MPKDLIINQYWLDEISIGETIMDSATLKEHIETIGEFVRQYHNLNHPDELFAQCGDEPCLTQRKLEEMSDEGV